MTKLSPIPVPLEVSRTPVETGPLVLQLWLGRWRILLAALVLATLGAQYAYGVAQPIYRTHVSLMLEPQEAQVIDIGLVLPGLGHDAQILNTQSQVLRSRSLVETLVDDLSLVDDPRFNASLRPPSRFSIRKITAPLLVRAGFPPEEQEPINAEAARNSTINTVIRALQVDIVPDSLVVELSIGTPDPDKSARIVNRLAELYVEDQVSAKLEATEQATAWLTDRVAGLEAQLKLAESRARATRTMRGLPTVEQTVQMERQLEAVRSALANARADAGNRAALLAQADDLTQRLAAATNALVQLDQLEREANTTRLLYESFLTRLKETTVQTGVIRPDARILSAAVPPLYPAAPKPALIVLLALIAGAGLGALWVLGRAQWGPKIKMAPDAKRLTGLPLATMLPEARDRRVRPLDTLTRRPNAALSDAIRGLRSKVLLGGTGRKPSVIVVTSTMSGEGKTTQTMLLAQSLATWGKKVIVVEADLRSQGLTAAFGAAPRRGIISVLAGICSVKEALFRPDGAGVDVLLAETASSSAADAFSTNRFDRLLKELQESYDHILIDAPATTHSAEVGTIAARADMLLYLIRWNHTKRGPLLRGLAQLQGRGVPLPQLVATRTAPSAYRRLETHPVWTVAH